MGKASGGGGGGGGGDKRVQRRRGVQTTKPIGRASHGMGGNNYAEFLCCAGLDLRLRDELVPLNAYVSCL